MKLQVIEKENWIILKPGGSLLKFKIMTMIGFYGRVPPQAKIGDTVIINDTLGKVISVLPALGTVSERQRAQN